MDNLKPCPFCGGEAMITGNPGSSRMYVRCKNCDAKSSHDYERNAIAAWNTRHAPASKPLDLDELRSMAGSVVWVADLLIPTCNAWHFVEAVDDAIYLFDKTAIARGIVGYNATTGHNYGKTWLAYAAKPAEEVSK